MSGGLRTMLVFQSTLPRRERPQSTRSSANSIIFQSTLPRRERPPYTRSSAAAWLYFNPRSREGSDTSPDFTCMISLQFQSTLPRRERPHAQTFLAAQMHNHFNPRSREGSDKPSQADAVRKLVFQSTLPRRERPWSYSIMSCSAAISIHAPAKGATPCVCAIACRSSISIHAPAKGATFLLYLLFVISSIFQSTLPRRERQTGCFRYPAPSRISIHAPAKGATISSTCCYLRRQFQSTLPRRERRLMLSIMAGWQQHFNPRSREGSDTFVSWMLDLRDPFQSTLPRRERPSYMHATHVIPQFQSTLPRRERPTSLYNLCHRYHFNPRSREGSDSKNHQDHSR